MKNLKKLLAIILSFALTISLWSTAATAAIVIDDEGMNDTLNVTYYDGEEALPELSTSVSAGTSITLPTYSKAGKNFDGWKLNNEGDLLEAGYSYIVEDPVDFYAQFSQGAYVATVSVDGGSTTNCTTMEEARVAALKAGDTPVTIHLLSDTSIDARLQLRDPDGTTDTLARNITIDLNGFTLSKAATMNGFFFINKQATLTVKGGTLDCKSYGGNMFAGNSGSTTIVESGTYTNFGSIATDGAAEGLKISGGTWDSAPIDNLADSYEVIKNADGIHFDVVAKAGDDIYSLSDGTNEATFASMDALQLAIDYFAGKRTNIKLLKDVTTDARIGLVAGTETVPIEYNYDLNGHRLTYTGSSQGFVLVRAYDSFNINDTADGGGVTVSGQSYYFTSNKNPGTLTVNAGTYAGATSFANTNTQLVINGGTWNIDPTAYVDATNYEVVQSGGVYTVNKLSEGTPIYTLSELTTALATGGDDYVLKADIEVTDKLDAAVGVETTIDLKGHRIYRTTGGDIMIVNGTLTIKDTSAKADGYIGFDTSSISTTTASPFEIASTGTFNLKSGGIKNLYSTHTSAQVIKNGGKFNMTGGFITNIQSANRRGIQNAVAKAVMNLSGGEIYGNTNGSSGTDVFLYRGTVNISDKMMINGTLKTATGYKFNITGGWFSTRPDATWIADGHYWKSDTTTHSGYAGHVLEGEEPKAAEVTISGKTTTYDSFDEAITAAVETTDSATIKLLDDCVKTSKVTTVAVDTTVTLDLNGKNLTNTYTNTTASSTNHRYFSVAGTLNIVDTAKGGSITGNNNYTGSGAVAYAAATGTIVVSADSSFYNGAAQAVDTNNNRAFSRANSDCPITISAGWFTDISKPATGYLANGYNRVEVADASKAAAPITVSTTTKTIQYDANGGGFSSAISDQVYAYITGYTTLLNARDFSVALKTGYTCVGWSADKDAQPGDASVIDTTGTNFAAYAGNTIILYAIYQEVDPSMWVCVDTNDHTIGYADLASAFAGSNDVTLINDVEGRASLVPSSEARLNLNGYNIVGCTAEEAAGSTLSIKGTVSIYNEDAGTFTVGEGDKQRQISMGDEGIVEGYAQGTGGAIDVIGSNNGVLKIYGGTFKGDAPKNGSVITNTGAGKIYIYKGEFIETNPDTTSASSLYANTGWLFVIPENQSDVKIQGTLAGASGSRFGITGGYFAEAQPTSVKIGTFAGDNIVVDTTKALRKLSGDDDYSYMVAPNSALVADEDGNIYATFEEALAAVSGKEDAELVIAGDVTLSGAVTYSNDISINLNGFNMTGDMAVDDNKMLSMSNASNYSGTITSTGFVYIDGTLKTDGVVNQTATAQRVEKMGGDITDTLGATIIGRIALKAGDTYPSLTYVDPVEGTTKTLDSTNVGNGVWTYDLDNIYVNYIAANLNLTFTQDGAKVSDPYEYSLLDYYEACYTGGKDAKLDAMLANTIYYAHELYLMSGKGVAFDLPEWVAGAKLSSNPVAGDNVQKVTKGTVDAANFKIKSATVNVTMKSGLMFAVLATDTTTKAVTLEVTKGSGTPASYVISLNSPTPGVESAGNGLYNVKVDKISPVDYAATYTVTLKVGGTVYHAVEYSVNSYCFRKYTVTETVGQTTTGSVALALYNFGKAALAYTAK